MLHMSSEHETRAIYMLVANELRHSNIGNPVFTKEINAAAAWSFLCEYRVTKVGVSQVSIRLQLTIHVILRYNDQGYVEHLPNMISERYSHACSSYLDTNNRQVNH